MEVMMGEDDRKHFRLEMENEGIFVEVKIGDDEVIQGVIRDVSDSGIAFTLNETPSRDVTNHPVRISFNMNQRLFQFDMRILRKFRENGVRYYAGEFIEISKIKQSQLSLLLMKMKLNTKR